jgi:hypothetical protein
MRTVRVGKGFSCAAAGANPPNSAQVKRIKVVQAFNNVECDRRLSARLLNCELLLRLDMAVFPPQWPRALAHFFRRVVWRHAGLIGSAFSVCLEGRF